MQSVVVFSARRQQTPACSAYLREQIGVILQQQLEQLLVLQILKIVSPQEPLIVRGNQTMGIFTPRSEKHNRTNTVSFLLGVFAKSC